MNESKPSFAGRYLKLVLASLVMGGLAAAVGFAPTRNLAGDSGVTAMFAGCAVAVVAGWIGGLVACQPGSSGPERINRLLGATALRMFAAVGLALAAVFAGEFSTKPLVLWVALAYMITLVGETALFVRWTKQDETNTNSSTTSQAAQSGK